MATIVYFVIFIIRVHSIRYRQNQAKPRQNTTNKNRTCNKAKQSEQNNNIRFQRQDRRKCPIFVILHTMILLIDAQTAGHRPAKSTKQYIQLLFVLQLL